MSRTSCRSAFTLLELLVVIAVLGIVLALTMPAVQRARDGANRTHCANNLRQLGMALQNYEGVHRVFPPGVSYQNGLDPFPFMSWNTRLLPYLEYAPLWQMSVAAYNTKKPFWETPPHVGFSTIVPNFACPADPQAQCLAGPGGRYAAFTSYLGVEGTNQFLRDGVLFLDSKLRLSEIRDGTSNTLMVGERPSTIETSGWWYAGYGQNKDGSADMVLGVSEVRFGGWGPKGCKPGTYTYGPGRFDNPCDVLHFWSPHAGGGANFLFADGSVHFITYDAVSIMPALATRAGRENASLP